MQNVKDILIQARENAEKNGCSDVATYISDSQQITRNKFLSITERGVLQSMFYWFHSGLQKSIGRYKLASELDLSVRTITTVVQKLEMMGFIEVKRRKNKLNVYTLKDFSDNPYLVLSNVIRKRELELLREFSKLGLEEDERYQKVDEVFKGLCKGKEFYSPYINGIKEGADAREKYDIAKELVSHWEQYGGQINVSDNVVPFPKKETAKKPVKSKKRKIKRKVVASE